MIPSSTKRALIDVKTFVVPIDVIEETIAFLRKVGSAGYEGFVLWGGQRESNEVFRFRSTCIPEQRASRTESGLVVYVEGAALFAVNKTLFERGEVLGAQVHSHPTNAYHSELDDAYPLATLTGAISLVVPDFARNAPADIDAWAWYRLQPDNSWQPIDKHTEISFE